MSLTRPLRAYPIASYFVLACLFGWILFLLAPFRAGAAQDQNPLGPILAAAIVAAAAGRAGWTDWLSWLKRLRAPLSLYAVALVAPIVMTVLIILINHAFGAPLPTSSQLAGWTELPATFLFILVVIGVGEEAGWTAFATPKLLARETFLMAWLGMAAIRVAWHLPLMLNGELPWSLGIVGNAAFQFVLLWLFVRSGGVWFLAAIWHAMLNTTSGNFVFPMYQGADAARLAWIMSLCYVALAVGLYVLDRERLGTPFVAPDAALEPAAATTAS